MNSVRKIGLFLLISLLTTLPLLANEKLGHDSVYLGKHSYVSNAGYVPDSDTAVMIAVQIFRDAFGDEYARNIKLSPELTGSQWKFETWKSEANRDKAVPISKWEADWPRLTINKKDGAATLNFQNGAGYTKDLVTDKDAAIKIAEAVWLPIYGKEVLDHEKPFKAELEGGIWNIHGFLPEERSGGVAEIEINKTDGKILRVSHGK